MASDKARPAYASIELESSRLLNMEIGCCSPVVPSTYVGHVGGVRGRDDVLDLLAVEDVDGREVGLGVAVLARLGGADVHDLAGAALDHDVAVEPGTGNGVPREWLAGSPPSGHVRKLSRACCLLALHALLQCHPLTVLTLPS